MLRVTPRQREEKKKHHGTFRDTIAASSRVLSLSLRGDTQWVYSVGLIFRSVRTNKIISYVPYMSYGPYMSLKPYTFALQLAGRQIEVL